MYVDIPATSGSIEDPAGVFPQSQWDPVDVQILSLAAGGVNGISSGCAVTAQGSPNMTVAVASGTVVVAGTEVAVTSGNVTVTAAHATLRRFDLITVNNAGTKACTAGTAASSPVFPAIPANSVVLAAVYVPAADTAINSNQIKDRRVQVPTPATASGWTTVSKAGDESRNTTTTLADDGTLKFTMAASTKYRIRGTVWAIAGTTPDFKYGFAGPASPDVVVFRRRSGTDAAAYSDLAPDVAYPTAVAISSVSAADGITLSFEAIVHNGANAGTFSFQWAQNTSNGTNTTVRAGSYIDYKVS